ncbi:hypothetical protein A9G33_05150 [Gilliamella sp. Choc3-5]|uniref:hypothetical protein n=1 Tax=Gilliamella sp. Choc3-5 TaxID=3120236 RepID=UPI00080ED45E|nr:hypothetical protein [Gilliamella apicola]OCG31423.1 hypothetical protein A9G33_05150 [Gilliamella apicola]
MFFCASHSGSDIQDVNTAIAEGKNAVENNGLSWANGGLGGDFIGLSPETGANYEGILHASAAGYLTQEETDEALKRLITGKDMPNGSDYVELWMRAPEQIGAFLPGPISAAMAALAMADKSLTDTDKADLISVLNKATGDYLSGANTESLLELNTALSRFGAKSTNKQFQQFIKEKVENNVATSQKGNKSSQFGEHVKKEQDINANLGKRPEDKIWTETSKKESVKNAYDHWDKHKHEFPEFQNSKQYVDATHNFVRNPPEGTLTKVRENGDTLYYNPSTNIFAIKNADGTPRTMFKPNPADHGYKTNLEYFNAQK